VKIQSARKASVNPAQQREKAVTGNTAPASKKALLTGLF
jgi:hypothetical protein